MEVTFIMEVGNMELYIIICCVTAREILNTVKKRGKCTSNEAHL